MTRRSAAGLCSRSWQAEALRDRRLSALDRSAFEEHAASCDACEREVGLLEALDRAMANVGAAPNPFTRAKLRAELLRRASSSSGRRTSARTKVRATIAALVVTGGVFAAGAFLSAGPRWQAVAEREGEVERAVAHAPPRFEAWPSPGATLTTRLAGSTTELDLADGAVAFWIAPLGPRQRFVVKLPAGEIETDGARFSTEVAGGHTRSVRVDEGRLTLRRAAATMHLVAGEKWTDVDSTLRAPDPARAAGLVPTKPRTGAPTELEAGAEARVREASSLEPLSVAEQFEGGVEAFRRGDYDGADAVFGRFVQRHPEDPRAEDAAYLRAVSRWRLGDITRASSLARAYLEHYPEGLRSAEARRIATGAPRPSGDAAP